MANANEETPLERTYQGDPLIGRTVGEYVVRERIGTGGAGIVYRGEHPAIGKPVAIKVLKPELAEDPEQMRALLDEARVVNAIGDRGIVDVFGFGQLPDGRQYLVMEYLQGERLEALYRNKKLGISEVLSLLDQILRALAAAHGAGVIHRDLKPQNIFAMRAPDGTRYIKLLDFGLARRMSPNSKQTTGGGFSGTPNYMSPEQIRRESLTARSDLYSVGSIGFELLTGRPPFDSGTIDEVTQRHLSAPIPSVKAVRPDVPAELDALLSRLLAKRAEDRPASAEAVRAELSKIRKARASSKRRDDPRKGDPPEELSSPGVAVFEEPPATTPKTARLDAQKWPKADPSLRPALDLAAGTDRKTRGPPTQIEFLPGPAVEVDAAARAPAAGSFLRMMCSAVARSRSWGWACGWFHPAPADQTGDQAPTSQRRARAPSSWRGSTGCSSRSSSSSCTA